MGSKLFSYTGGWQNWTVPTGVTAITVYMNGGGAGSRRGGRVEGRLAVTPGKKLYLVCGGAGKPASGESGGGVAYGGGAPGGDGKSGQGGDGGGGFSEIRRDSTAGTIVAVAGGAGGDSGDNGFGGDGGGTTGESGSRGSSGSNSTGAATGGTQSQGGNGGTSSSGSEFNGGDAPNTAVALAGAGGQSAHYSYGGGGGGGGWRSGGGGQAASKGYAPGGGGGGGSNYVGGMTSTKTIQGYATGNGAVQFLWTDPAPANLPPTTPTAAQIDGVTESPAYPSKSTGTVTISATLNDPDASPADTIRLLVRLSTKSDFSTYSNYYTGYVARGKVASYKLTGLAQNTRYYVRLFGQDNHGLYSTGYNSLDFWTNRPPSAPRLTAPADNASVPSISSLVFTWTHLDPDPSDPMVGWEWRYRTAATSTVNAGPWVVTSKHTNTSPTWTINPNTFRGNTFYEWSARTIDHGGIPGEWAVSRSFYVTSLSSPPVPIAPKRDVALDAHAAITFSWKFVDPDAGDSQRRADIRYRLVGQDDTAWVTRIGAVDPGTPGSNSFWVMPPDTFVPGYNYEWEVRTYDTLGTGTASDWSGLVSFWAIGTPGSGAVAPVPDFTSVQGALGCGDYRVFIYAQGGNQVIGEVTPMSSLNFKRVRDDISNCIVQTNGFADDCCALYASLRCWMHEVVVFRSGVRVWEGPITRLGYSVGSVEIEAKDVMGYLYRRVMRQGFNDSYQTVPGSSTDPHQKIVLPTMNVVERAQWIIMNALAPYDPNILPYLTTIQFDDDAKQSRIIPDYSQTAWEQVDDMAATSGLDYTVIGRRIILWDTHRAIGRLPEMRDGDFSDPPVVTEYGMQLCNFMAVTNGSGVMGYAVPRGQVGRFEAYGPVEMVATGYSDAAAASSDVLTNDARQKLVDDFTTQAKVNIADRWPTPVIVRVPDNSTLHPDVNVGFDQLVPGVWIPLRSNATCREVVQWQKLDSVTVTVGEQGEQVQVVMSPAPNGGDDDPDRDAAAEEAG